MVAEVALVSRGTVIRTSRSRVWEQLADLGAVAEWHPGVESAELGSVAEGVGASRVCELGDDGRLDEVVSVWEPGRQLWFAVEGRGAIRSAEFGFVLTDDADGTKVEAIADYHLALGPLGPVVDHLTIRRHMTRMMTQTLDGLKVHLESLDVRG